MNTHINPIRRSNGSVLITTLALTGCIGIMLTGTLFLMSNQNYSIRRSQIWNLQIPAVEAGIEEAMCHLNNNCYVSDLSPSGKTPQWSGVDGWIVSGYCVYSKSNTLPDGSYYIDTIVSTDPNNVQIFSEGHVFGASLCMNFPQPIFATIGDAHTSSTAPTRTVRVCASNAGMFANGLAARESIDMNGNGITTDSFDSSNPAYSTQGLYDSSKHRAHGDIATANGLSNATSISILNANINGNVSTAPNGTVTLGPNGYVSGTITHDLNVTFPDVKTPDGVGWIAPTGGSVTNIQFTATTNWHTTAGYPIGQNPIVTNYVAITLATFPNFAHVPVTTNTVSATTANPPSPSSYATGTLVTNYNGKSKAVKNYTYSLITGYTYAQVTNYSYCTVTNLTSTAVVTSYMNILNDGAYKISNLSGSTYVRGDAKLWVTTGLNVSGIVIAPGASLKLYSGAASVTLSGNGVVNQGGNATNFFFYGLPTCTSISLSGNAGFTGCIYAPNADFTLNGGGNDDKDFIGAGVFKTVKMNGHFCFHYDEQLRKFGPRTGYVINSWLEVPTQTHYFQSN